jgi:hypothetical protein
MTISTDITMKIISTRPCSLCVTVITLGMVQLLWWHGSSYSLSYIYIYIVYSNIRWDLNLSPYLGTHILQRMERHWHNLCISMWTKAESKMFKIFHCQGYPRFQNLVISL